MLHNDFLFDRPARGQLCHPMLGWPLIFTVMCWSIWLVNQGQLTHTLTTVEFDGMIQLEPFKNNLLHRCWFTWLKKSTPLTKNKLPSCSDILLSRKIIFIDHEIVFARWWGGSCIATRPKYIYIHGRAELVLSVRNDPSKIEYILKRGPVNILTKTCMYEIVWSNNDARKHAHRPCKTSFLRWRVHLITC